jgi:hypothetical protein
VQSKKKALQASASYLTFTVKLILIINAKLNLTHEEPNVQSVKQPKLDICMMPGSKKYQPNYQQ